MSKVYIVSTHRFMDSASYGGRWASSFLPCFKREVPDGDWNSCFGELGSIMDGFHYYYELPGDADCRVYAVHELPAGNGRMSGQWIKMLSRFFVKEQDDDVCFILHDKDLSDLGRPCFYSFIHSGDNDGRRFRVYGFQHDHTDKIWKFLSNPYATSPKFSEAIELVLEVVRAKEILEDCLSGHKYPDQECGLLSNCFSVNTLHAMYPNPNSLDYLNYLRDVKRRILKMV